MMLVFAMLFSMMGVFASEPVASEDDFVVVASAQKDLGDGVILVKELSVERSKLRAGFSGEKTVRASDSVYLNNTNNLIAKISIQATFYSTVGKNECYMKNYKYNIDKNSALTVNIKNVSESTEINWSAGSSFPNYSRYVVDYDIVGHREYDGSYNMFVRCASNGTTSSTGNTSNKSITNDLKYVWDDVVISF